jgi:hypothetical protein
VLIEGDGFSFLYRFIVVEDIEWFSGNIFSLSCFFCDWMDRIRDEKWRSQYDSIGMRKIKWKDRNDQDGDISQEKTHARIVVKI